MSLVREMESALGGQPVRVKRHYGEWEPLDGIVTSVSSAWSVLAVLNDGYLDGYAVVRTSDISEVESYCADTFIIKAYELERPPDTILFSSVADDLERLIAEVSQVAPLVSFYREAVDPDDLLVGIPEFTTKDEVVLTEVGADANLGEKAGLVLKNNDVSRLEFGGRYLRRLAEIVLPEAR
jgi:hypothetical protein